MSESAGVWRIKIRLILLSGKFAQNCMNSVQYTGEGEGRAWKIRLKCIDKKSAKPLTANRDYYLFSLAIT
jgi:hypothetical protein